jgi:hypothetical protein
MRLKEYQNMIDVKLRSVNFRDTATYERSHVVKELSDDVIKEYERGDISRLEFAAKLVTDKKNYIRLVPAKLQGCVAAQ